MRKALTFIVIAALAQAHSAWASERSYDDQKAELEAQIDLLGKRKQLDEILRSSAESSFRGMPAVVAIMGIEGRMVARLQQPNGTVMNYAEGEIIRPGIVVATITSRSVTVRVGSGKKSSLVPLERLAGATQGLAGAGGMPSPQQGQPLPPELLPMPPVVARPLQPLPMGVPPAPVAQPAPAAMQPAAAVPAGMTAPTASR